MTVILVKSITKQYLRPIQEHVVKCMLLNFKLNLYKIFKLIKRFIHKQKKLCNKKEALPVQASIPAVPKYILPKRIRYHHLTENVFGYPTGVHRPFQIGWDDNLD